VVRKGGFKSFANPQAHFAVHLSDVLGGNSLRCARASCVFFLFEWYGGAKRRVQVIHKPILLFI